MYRRQFRLLLDQPLLNLSQRCSGRDSQAPHCHDFALLLLQLPFQGRSLDGCRLPRLGVGCRCRFMAAGVLEMSKGLLQKSDDARFQGLVQVGPTLD